MQSAPTEGQISAKWWQANSAPCALIGRIGLHLVVAGLAVVQRAG